MTKEQLTQFTHKVVALIDGEQVAGVFSTMPQDGGTVNCWFPFKKDLQEITQEMILLTIGKITFHADIHLTDKNELSAL